ncbi:MAG: hypothetical protein GYB35_09930 [Algicola sp.]|nr:hypothetical protein [Algicola sp.]
MIKSYKYLISCHIMLHQHVMEFFDNIEYQTGPFQNSFFGPDFIDIVNRHPRIVKKPLKDIYNVLSRLNQPSRSALIQQIKDSNKVKEICEGSIQPVRLDRNVSGTKKIFRDFFIKLYNQVLDGDAFREKYNTTLRNHFNDFRQKNEETTICPTCGIGELKMKEAKTRDQYDHYLPKALYPFSSVNFENLVLSCKECNSTDVKGDNDTIAVSTGRFFYPFDSNHSKLIFEYSIDTDNIDCRKIEWTISITSPDAKVDEIQSWRDIYDIDDRYKGFVAGRIEKWYRWYWEYINDSDFAHLSEADIKLTCLKALKLDEKLELSFIRKPALDGFLKDSVLSRAQIEAKYYSD